MMPVSNLYTRYDRYTDFSPHYLVYRDDVDAGPRICLVRYIGVQGVLVKTPNDPIKGRWQSMK